MYAILVRIGNHWLVWTFDDGKQLFDDPDEASRRAKQIETRFAKGYAEIKIAIL